MKVCKSLDHDGEYRLVDHKVFDAKKWGTRHVQCFYLFVALTVACSMRSCLAVALVAMTQHDTGQPIEIENGTLWRNASRGHDNNGFKTNGFFNALLLTPPYPQLEWSKKVQDTVISSFYWGYMSLQIPAGHLAYKFGARYLLCASLLINFLFSSLFPVIAYYGGWVSALICRLIQGLSQACMYPSIHTMLGRWSPLEDRGRMSCVILRGQALGTLLGLSLSGFIASTPLGWPGIFWFYGILSGICAAVIWYYLVDLPSQHRTISMAERTYIEEALKQKKDQKLPPVPWIRILTSRGMIAILIAHIGNAWCHLILYIEVPAYMDKVMGLNIQANSLLTALPFMTMILTHFFFSWLTDMIIVKKYLSVTHTRKFANTLGSVPAAIGFIALAYAPKNIYVVESILVAICAFKISDQLGYIINPVDISPNFAGVMMSISNFSSNFAASFSPIITACLVTDVTDQHQWRKVFLLSGGLYFGTNLVYVLLGTSDLADWNDPEQYEKVALNDNVDKKDKNGHTEKDVEKN